MHDDEYAQMESRETSHRSSTMSTNVALSASLYEYCVCEVPGLSCPPLAFALPSTRLHVVCLSPVYLSAFQALLSLPCLHHLCSITFSIISTCSPSTILTHSLCVSLSPWQTAFLCSASCRRPKRPAVSSSPKPNSTSRMKPK